MAGNLIHTLACADIQESGDLSCFYQDSNIYISCGQSLKVSCVNAATGTIEWTFNTPTKPGGLICYHGSYLLVTLHANLLKLLLLDIITGEKVGELTVDETGFDQMTYFDDLSIVDGDTLIVPSDQENLIRLYKLCHDE